MNDQLILRFEKLDEPYTINLYGGDDAMFRRLAYGAHGDLVSVRLISRVMREVEDERVDCVYEVTSAPRDR